MVLIESVSGSVILAHDGVLKFSRVHNNGNELQVYNYTACITTAPLFKWNEDKALHNLQLVSKRYLKKTYPIVVAFFCIKVKRTGVLEWSSCRTLCNA
ncbi:hypothetical protein T4C_9544 [Trichinella pseudospiralis]|uniref:Uncharacterized protein n=1 Tax=Trichinella pseudospiralis TaxID=6337 RepID=A0A0V1K7P3_TRIPS|nr:hypothetical protein T4C_9544 [Trichinella pseudospiralis]